MPMLPLFTPPPANADASASRQVIAPGGTEWWHVDAEDRTSGLLVVADLFAGSPFDSIYQKQVRRFLHNPTVIHPPSPRDYAIASVAVYQNGMCIGSMDERVPQKAFSASSTALDVRCGPLQLVAAEDSIRVTCESSDLNESPSLDLTFTPRLRVPAREFRISTFGRPGTFLNWICGAPSYDVTGEVQISSKSGVAETLGFAGRGFHECTFAAGLLARELDGWTRRRVISDARTWVSHRFVFQGKTASTLFFAAASTDVGWTSLDAGDWPAVEALGRQVGVETYLPTKRTVCDVNIENVSARSLIECYGEDYSS